MTSVWAQAEFNVAFEWGASGAAELVLPGDTLVVVDVLSFTTSVSVVVDRGTAVYPAVWRDERAGVLAASVDAELAVARSEVTPETPWSLSPAALRSAPMTSRLVLPSPNGSAVASLSRDATVAAGCFRNAVAVGRWAAGRISIGSRVCVIAAGERWSDGSLRPSLEDALGAGAVINAMAASSEASLSREAEAVRAMYAATSELRSAVGGCSSARELHASGFGDDVDIALEVDSSEVVPVMTDGAFRASTK